MTTSHSINSNDLLQPDRETEELPEFAAQDPEDLNSTHIQTSSFNSSRQNSNLTVDPAHSIGGTSIGNLGGVTFGSPTFQYSRNSTHNHPTNNSNSNLPILLENETTSKDTMFYHSNQNLTEYEEAKSTNFFGVTTAGSGQLSTHNTTFGQTRSTNGLGHNRSEYEHATATNLKTVNSANTLSSEAAAAHQHPSKVRESPKSKKSQTTTTTGQKNSELMPTFNTNSHSKEEFDTTYYEEPDEHTNLALKTLVQKHLTIGQSSQEDFSNFEDETAEIYESANETDLTRLNYNKLPSGVTAITVEDISIEKREIQIKLVEDQLKRVTKTSISSLDFSEQSPHLTHVTTKASTKHTIQTSNNDSVDPNYFYDSVSNPDLYVFSKTHGMRQKSDIERQAEEAAKHAACIAEKAASLAESINTQTHESSRRNSYFQSQSPQPTEKSIADEGEITRMQLSPKTPRVAKKIPETPTESKSEGKKMLRLPTGENFNVTVYGEEESSLTTTSNSSEIIQVENISKQPEKVENLHVHSDFLNESAQSSKNNTLKRNIQHTKQVSDISTPKSVENLEISLDQNQIEQILDQKFAILNQEHGSMPKLHGSGLAGNSPPRLARKSMSSYLSSGTSLSEEPGENFEHKHRRVSDLSIYETDDDLFSKNSRQNQQNFVNSQELKNLDKHAENWE